MKADILPTVKAKIKGGPKVRFREPDRN